jgi:hypothetical protein
MKFGTNVKNLHTKNCQNSNVNLRNSGDLLETAEAFAFLVYYAAYVGSWLPTFRNNTVFPSSRIKQHQKHPTPQPNLKSRVVRVTGKKETVFMEFRARILYCIFHLMPITDLN